MIKKYIIFIFISIVFLTNINAQIEYKDKTPTSLSGMAAGRYKTDYSFFINKIFTPLNSIIQRGFMFYSVDDFSSLSAAETYLEANGGFLIIPQSYSVDSVYSWTTSSNYMLLDFRNNRIEVNGGIFGSFSLHNSVYYVPFGSSYTDVETAITNYDVVFLFETYDTVNDTLVLKNLKRKKIIGIPNKTIIDHSGSGNYVAEIVDCDSMIFEGITFNRGRISVKNMTNSTFRDCTFQNAVSTQALDLGECANIYITGCMFRDNNQHGLEVNDSKGVKIIGSTFERMGNKGMEFWGDPPNKTTFSSIVGSHFRNNGVSGVYIYHSDHISVIGNTFDGDSSQAVFIDNNSDHNTVGFNTIFQKDNPVPAENGILLQNGAQGTCDSNTVAFNTYIGPQEFNNNQSGSDNGNTYFALQNGDFSAMVFLNELKAEGFDIYDGASLRARIRYDVDGGSKKDLVIYNNQNDASADIIFATNEGGSETDQLRIKNNGDLEHAGNILFTADASFDIGVDGTRPDSIFGGDLSLKDTQPVADFIWTNTANSGFLQFKENTTQQALIIAIGSTFATSARRNDLEIDVRNGGDITFWSASTQRMIVENSGDVGIGSEDQPSANGGKTLFFGDNAGDPTPGTNTGVINGKDVAGTVEMYAWDEGGGGGLITPHVRTGKFKDQWVSRTAVRRGKSKKYPKGKYIIWQEFRMEALMLKLIEILEERGEIDEYIIYTVENIETGQKIIYNEDPKYIIKNE